MAFVNELIPEEQKDKFPFQVHARADGSKPTLWKWTIDRERNAYLVLANKEGGAYDGTPEVRHFVLAWQGNLIHFSGASVLSSGVGIERVLSWRIYRLVVSQELEGLQDEILELIREALNAMGWLYCRDRIGAVNVKFDIDSLCCSGSNKWGNKWGRSHFSITS